MSISDVLKEIAPCDRNRPYIFISYSSADRELVWRDALEFQRRGYNIWLDEKNLDKTNASWKQDALNAISDMYCCLLIFYVSKTSLVSEACYRELLMTTDAYTVAMHMGPVKFIAIDVLDVGKINTFAAAVYESVFANGSLSKEEKHARFLTLNNFMKKFFDSNNERVRIHPKNELNRKMDYYDEIISAFPDGARTCPPPEREEETCGPAVPEEPRSKSPEVVFPPEPPKEEPPQIEGSQMDQPQKEPETPQAPVPEPPGEQGRLTTQLLLEAMERANEADSVAFKFQKVSALSEKRLQNAIKTFGGTAVVSDVVGLCDTTLFGTGKEGYLLTKTRLYSKFFPKGVFIELSRVKQVSPGKGSHHLLIQYRNGTSQNVFANIYDKMIQVLLNTIAGGIGGD